MRSRCRRSRRIAGLGAAMLALLLTAPALPAAAETLDQEPAAAEPESEPVAAALQTSAVTVAVGCDPPVVTLPPNANRRRGVGGPGSVTTASPVSGDP